MASNYPNGQNGGPGQFPTFNQLPGEMNGLSGFSYPEQGFPGTSNDLQQFQDLDADALNLAFDQLEAYFNPDSTIPTGVGAGNQNLEFFYPQAVASENHVASSEPFKGVIDQGQTGDLHGVGVNIPNGMDVDHTAQDITHHTQSIAHIDHDDEVAQEVPHTEVAGNLPQIEADGFVEEPLCRIKTFYVGGAWPMGSNSSAAQHRVGQMHVEQMDPEKITKAQAIILIHGDFHHGKIWHTKPDGNPGWVSFFLRKGYQVFVVDLPPTGRSNFLTPTHFKRVEMDKISRAIHASAVEHELTAMEHFCGHGAAHLHHQWPGTGKRGDPIFDKYCETLSTLVIPKKERQILGQHGLSALLKQMDRKAILIGEGTGSNIAWLANDVNPDKVAAVVAVEPAGPPFGKPAKSENGKYTGSIQRDRSIRPYGLTDIPLTYEPAPHFSDDVQNMEVQDPLDVVEVTKPGTEIIYYMQDGPRPGGLVLGRDANEESPTGIARQLVNLKKTFQALITAEASQHSVYDWMTSAFMRQAGVTVDWIRLEENQIRGNGHLMFLEKNSDQVAALIERWIDLRMNPPPTTSGTPAHHHRKAQHSVSTYHARPDQHAAAMGQQINRGGVPNTTPQRPANSRPDGMPVTPSAPKRKSFVNRPVTKKLREE